MQIKPLMKLTHDIMGVTSIHYAWHEFFPRGIFSAIAVLKAPIICISLLLITIILCLRTIRTLMLTAKYNVGALISVWVPVILVCLYKVKCWFGPLYVGTESTY